LGGSLPNTRLFFRSYLIAELKPPEVFGFEEGFFYPSDVALGLL
jgi:hypothetical protein